MRRLLLSLLALLCVMVMVSCGNTAFSMHDFGTQIYVPQYAKGFRILGTGDGESVIIETLSPWQGTDSTTTRLFIARDGDSAPTGFDGQVMQGNAQRIVAMSSTHIAMLDAIGATESVVGVSGMDFVFNPYVASHRSTIGDVGYDSNINYELLMSLSPDVVLLYGVNGANPIQGKLTELGIPYIYIGDYLEESPLGKAEWMVAIAELLGQRRHGEAVYEQIPQRYVALRDSVAAMSLPAPSVMLNVPYGDSWFLPPVNGYLSRLITDAGGRYIYQGARTNESVVIDQEEAYLLTSRADMWLNVGNACTMQELQAQCPKFMDTPPVLSGNVYNNTARTNAAGGNDYFESAVVRPDMVLRDLVNIFHPREFSDTLVYHIRLK